MAVTAELSYQGIVTWAKTASNGIVADSAAVATKVGTANVGSATGPVYIKAGVPTACNSSLAVSITGNAATASSATTAATCTGNSATAQKLGTSANSLTSAGGTNTPVYFSAGVPAACTTIGNGTLPVYIQQTAQSNPGNGQIWIEP